MKKIVIALDSFKGCLTSAEAGEAAAQGVHAACPECRTIVLPVADGGEGMLDVLLAASNGKRITVRAHDPLMQPCDASYGISGDGNTAFVEMAAISGLPLVPADKRNPMKTTTFGTGELIRDALERGCLRFVIGLGGSATNDAGLGMLQALGFRFFDKEGHEVGSMEKGIALCGALLSAISSIDSSSAHPALKKSGKESVHSARLLPSKIFGKLQVGCGKREIVLTLSTRPGVREGVFHDQTFFPFRHACCRLLQPSR